MDQLTIAQKNEIEDYIKQIRKIEAFYEVKFEYDIMKDFIHYIGLSQAKRREYMFNPSNEGSLVHIRNVEELAQYVALKNLKETESSIEEGVILTEVNP